VPVEPEVVLAVVDEKSLGEQGKWVWPRTKLAEMIRILSHSSAKVVAFDVGFLVSEQNSIVEVVTSLENLVDSLGLDNENLGAYLEQAKCRAENGLIFAEAIKELKAKVELLNEFLTEMADVALAMREPWTNLKEMPLLPSLALQPS
jgi:adenylate cyclase